jgi:hypothetical protein
VGDQQQRRRFGRGELLGEVGREAGHGCSAKTVAASTVLPVPVATTTRLRQRQKS